MNPDKLVTNEHGEKRPECFGLCGFGDGYSYAARCDVRVCDSGGYCYAALREQVENRDPEAAAEYESRRQALRGEGLDSMTIVRTLAAQGFPPTTQDAYLENVRRGQLASGLWRVCRGPGCITLVRKSHDSVYCAAHEPHKESEDGAGLADEQRGDHRGRERVEGSTPPSTGRLGSASGPLDSVEP